jgi:hypothetical protein
MREIDPLHLIAEAARELYSTGEPIDSVSVANELMKRGQLQLTGGLTHLIKVQDEMGGDLKNLLKYPEPDEEKREVRVHPEIRKFLTDGHDPRPSKETSARWTKQELELLARIHEVTASTLRLLAEGDSEGCEQVQEAIEAALKLLREATET